MAYSIVTVLHDDGRVTSEAQHGSLPPGLDRRIFAFAYPRAISILAVQEVHVQEMLKRLGWTPPDPKS